MMKYIFFELRHFLDFNLLLVMSLLLFQFSAVCSAVMDTIDNKNESIFTRIYKKTGREWWSRNFTPGSWKNKYVDRQESLGRKKWKFNIYFGRINWKYHYVWRIDLYKPVQICDGWHFFKMLMISSLCLSLSLVYSFGYIGHHDLFLSLCALGLVWNLTFSLTSKILK